MGLSSCCSVNWPTLLTAFPLCGGGGLEPPQGLVDVCIPGHHVLLLRIWPHERKVQPHGAEAALGCCGRPQSAEASPCGQCSCGQQGVLGSIKYLLCGL